MANVRSQLAELGLQQYGDLLSGVAFYFLTDDGELGELSGEITGLSCSASVDTIRSRQLISESEA